MTAPISLPSSAQGPFVARSGDRLLILDRDGDTGALLTRLGVSAERALSLGHGLIAAAEAVMSEAGTMAAAPPEPPNDSAPVTVTVTVDASSELLRLVREPQEELTRVLGRLADDLAEVRERQGRDGARLAALTRDFGDVGHADVAVSCTNPGAFPLDATQLVRLIAAVVAEVQHPFRGFNGQPAGADGLAQGFARAIGIPLTAERGRASS